MIKKRALERIVRSFGNHRRIQILELLVAEPELSVSEVREKLKISEALASAHIRQLTIASLIMKKSQGKTIRHRLTKRGEYVLNFLNNLD